MVGSNNINKEKYLKNNQKNLLVKEIIVLVLFAVLITISILFLFPVAFKNIFFINMTGSADMSNFPSGNNTEVTTSKSKLTAINNNAEQNNNNNISKIDVINKIVKGRNYIEIFLAPSTISGPGNYLKINLKAKNNDSVDFPAGSINIKWKYESEKGYDPLNQENIQIFVDGLTHNYFNAAGENKNWKLNKKITSLMIQVPDVNGVNINISEISFNNRSIFPLDSYINRFFKDNFNIREINRFLIPAYIGLLFILAMAYLLKLVSKKVMTGKIIFSAAVIILFIFSIYFFKNEILNVKSYYDSYRKNIAGGDLKNTYLGFYDFEKFISWAGSKIPENENLIVLIRGEQIYIESELAYNLYPRDIKFINISKSSPEKIAGEISKINSEAARQNKNYKYLIALSDEDIKDDKILKLQYSYRTDAGLIFIIK